MRKQVYVKLTGVVQGVSFRYATLQKAKALDIFGWVRNTEDGGVEIVAQGEEVNLAAFIEWCEEGPDSSRVDKINVIWKNSPDDFDRFFIKY